MKRSTTTPLALALLLVLSACQASSQKVTEDVNYLIRHRRFDEAVDAAARAHRADPNDEEKLAAWKQASVAVLIDRARRLTFQDEDVVALEHLREAEAISPDHPDVLAWIDKTNHKLADRLFSEGAEAESEGELDTAQTRYEAVLEVQPDDANAQRGLARVLLLRNYHEGLGDGYYNDGVRALADYFLDQSYYRFRSSAKYKSDDPRVDNRNEQLRDLLAEERITIAQNLETEGLYAAARNEYRLALLLEENNAFAKEGLERMQVEVDAREHLRRADMLVRKGHFASANSELDAGEALTELQKDLFLGKRDGIQEARYENLYRIAITLEKDYQYPEAAKAYGRLLQQSEWFRDARTRKDTMEEYVRRAAELRARADTAASVEERVSLLRQIEVFWPEYPGLQDELGRLSDEPPPPPADAPQGR